MLWWTLRQLKSDDWRARVEAVVKLGQLKDVRSVEPLVIALEDKHSEVRDAAEHALANFGKPAVIPVVEALGDHNAQVREAAARVLVKIGSPAVEALGAALHDPDLAVRESAAAALGKIGDSTALEQLLAGLRRGDFGVKEAAAAGLVRTGGKAVKPLVAALRESKARVRETAAAALMRIGKPAIEPLIAALQDPDLREPANEVLWKIDPNWTKSSSARAVVPAFIAALQTGNENERCAAARVLGHVGDSAGVEPLLALLEANGSNVQEAAATALADIGDPRAFQTLVNLLKSGEASVCRAAEAALVRIGSAQVGPLVEALRDRDRAVRAAAAAVCVRIAQAVVEPLAEALWKIDPEWTKSDDVKPTVPRFVAAAHEHSLESGAPEALKAPGETRVIKPLVAALREKEMISGRPGAPLQSSPEIVMLTAALDSPDSKARATAIANLLDIGSQAVPPLVSALKNKSVSIRRVAAHALAEVGDVRGREVLRGDLKDASEIIVLDAAESLVKLDDLSPVQPLLKLAARSSEAHGVVAASSVHVSQRALRVLIELLQRHAPDFTAEDLRAVAHLHTPKARFVPASHAKPHRAHPATTDAASEIQSPPALDSADVSELARRELQRRSLKP